MVSRRRALQSLVATVSFASAGCSKFLSPSGQNGTPPDQNDNPPNSVGTDWFPTGETWPLPAGGPQNRRYSGNPVSQKPAVAWRIRPNESPGTEPIWIIGAATQETVYLVARSENHPVTVQARRATDGQVRWQATFEPGARIAGVINGTLYVIVGNREVRALDATDGQEQWHVDVYSRLATAVPDQHLSPQSNEVTPRLMPTPNVVYVASSYGFHGLAPADGQERWRAAVPHKENWARPLGLGVTRRALWASYGEPEPKLAELGNGPVRTINISDLDRPSAPVVLNSQVYVTGGRDGAVRQQAPVAGGYGREIGHTPKEVEPPEPEVLWRFPGFDSTGPTQISAPATDTDQLVFIQASPAFSAPGFSVATITLNLKDGTLRWVHETSVKGHLNQDRVEDFVFGTPMAVCGSILVSMVTTIPEDGPLPRNGRLLALNRKDGRPEWNMSIDVVPREIAQANNRIYITGRRGGIVALVQST